MSTTTTGAVLDSPPGWAAPGRQRLARRVGIAGGTLGVLAGLLQALIGSRIPRWTGAKADPVALGLLTVALSAVALAGLAALRGSRRCAAGGRTAVVVTLSVPAVLCFSTVGRLWFLPGVLLLTAGGILLGAGTRGDLRRVGSLAWPRGLLAVLGALQLLTAVTAAPVGTLLVGVAGGLAVLAAAWVAVPRRPRLLLVAVGTVPFALLTWSSLSSPLVAVIALALAACRLDLPQRTPR